MDFHHLKYFTEVADKKSFSKAARTLHISQSAISRTIKALEEELGVVLFMRNAKAVELTDAGAIFLTHAYGSHRFTSYYGRTRLCKFIRRIQAGVPSD